MITWRIWFDRGAEVKVVTIFLNAIHCGPASEGVVVLFGCDAHVLLIIIIQRLHVADMTSDVKSSNVQNICF